MQEVLPIETTQLHQTPNIKEILQRLQENISYQVEINRTYHLITDIINQFKLLMEYLPDESQELGIILNQLLKIQEYIEINISGRSLEFEVLKSEILTQETPCKGGGGCV